MSQIRLNLGCGNNTPEGWLNVDYALGARFAKVPFFGLLNKKFGLFSQEWDKRIMICDLRKKFPFSDLSVSVIYTSHTLEHLSKHEGLHFLAECHRVLKPEGIIRIVVPNLSSIVSNYNNGKIGADAFLDELCVVCDTSGMGFIKGLIAKQIFYPHKCMYDKKTLIDRLNEIGFQSEVCDAFESNISGIGEIESASRTQNAVIVEGKRLNI